MGQLVCPLVTWPVELHCSSWKCVAACATMLVWYILAQDL